MNRDEEVIRYADLVIKSRHVMLDKREQDELETLYKKIGLKACEDCGGEGLIVSPSIIGYGTEEGKCIKCDGLGSLNLSKFLIEKLKY
jgi:DnaJ-class molecular chaperone